MRVGIVNPLGHTPTGTDDALSWVAHINEQL